MADIEVYISVTIVHYRITNIDIHRGYCSVRIIGSLNDMYGHILGSGAAMQVLYHTDSRALKFTDIHVHEITV